eukprot:44682_1
MATELAAHIEQNEHDQKEQNEPKHEKSKPLEQSNYCALKQKKLFLGDIFKSNDLPKKKYKYYHKIWLLLVIPFIFHILTYGQIVHLIFCVFLVVICTFLLFFAFKRGNKNKQSVFNVLNDLLGIPNPMGSLYEINTTYYGITYLLCLLYYCIEWIIVYSFFRIPFMSDNFNWDDGSEFLEYVDNTPQLVVVVAEASISRYILDAMAVIIVSTYYIVDPDFATKLEDEKKKVLDRYDYTKIIQRIENGIISALEQNQIDKQPQKRKLEIFVVFFGAIWYRLCISYFFPGTLLNTLNLHNDITIGAGKSIIAVFIIIIDVTFLNIWYFYVQTVFFYHYDFIRDIMKQLALSIESTNIDDIIAWWELRKCYLSIIFFNVSGLSIYVLAALIVSLSQAISGFIFLSAGESDERWTGFVVSNIIILAYSTTGLFYGSTICVSYHRLQLSHINMLNKERLKLLQYPRTSNNEEFEMAEKIFIVLAQDIQQNDFPLSLLGVRMNANFMFFLRGVAISIVNAFFIEIS